VDARGEVNRFVARRGRIFNRVACFENNSDAITTGRLSLVDFITNITFPMEPWLSRLEPAISVILDFRIERHARLRCWRASACLETYRLISCADWQPSGLYCPRAARRTFLDSLKREAAAGSRALPPGGQPRESGAVSVRFQTEVDAPDRHFHPLRPGVGLRIRCKIRRVGQMVRIPNMDISAFSISLHSFNTNRTRVVLSIPGPEGRVLTDPYQPSLNQRPMVPRSGNGNVRV